MAAHSNDSERYLNQQNGNLPDESPELLRWRADALLDEMMLGGVDSYAASPARSASVQDGSATASAPVNGRNTDAPHVAAARNGSAAESPTNGAQWSEPFPDRLDANGRGYPSSSSPTSGRPPHSDYSYNQSPSDYSYNQSPSDYSYNQSPSDYSYKEYQEGQSIPSGSDPFPQHHSPLEQLPNGNRSSRTSHDIDRPIDHRGSGPTGDWSEASSRSSEERRPYPAGPARQSQPDESMLRPPSAVGGRGLQRPSSTSFLGTLPQQEDAPAQSAANGARNSYGSANAYGSENPYSQQPYPPSHADEAGQSYRRPFEQAEQGEPFPVQKETKPWSVVSGGTGDYLTSVPRRSDAPYSAPQTRYAYDPVLGPTALQQQASRFADSMAVGAQARRRTNVWPRHSRFDIQALHQEMATLQEQIDLLVRKRLDISERAQHLLDKGRTILENDPDRSAEVTYYVQQVRTMVQRTGQRVQWSNVYRTRLFTYLAAWFAFSTVVVVGCVLYGDLLRLWLSQFAPFALNGFLSQHIVALVGTLAAGTLGSALAALFNAWRHSQKEYGYFDRKYGMLGAVLPIIGLLAGLLLYVAFGVIYWLFEVNPVASPVAGWITAILAFAFGASQEKIYGTTE